MIQITYAPDGSSNWNQGVVLCNTSRSITELDVKFAHKRMLSVEQLATVLGSGTAALAQDFANWRNTLSLTVRRSVDFGNNAFNDGESALAFILQQPNSFPTTGTLKILLQGSSAQSPINTTLYLLNCGVEAMNLADALGLAPSIRYTFNGGLITSTSPF